MIKSQEFLMEKLSELSLMFEDIKIRYEYKKNTSSHIVEIIPLSIYKDSEAYMMAEANLEDEFESLFIDENIVFVSVESLTEIKNPDFKWGYDFFVYESIVYKNQHNNHVDVEGFNNIVDATGCEYYALAA